MKRSTIRLRIGPWETRALQFSAGPFSKNFVAFHGFSGSAEDFEPLAGWLPSGFGLMAVDWLGHGEADKPGFIDPYCFPTTSHWIQATLNRAREAAPLAGLIGYSMGGRLLVQAIASDGLTSTGNLPLFLIGSTTGIEDSQKREDRWKLDWARAREISRICQDANDPGKAFAEFWESIPIIASQRLLPEPLRSSIARRRRRNLPAAMICSLLGNSAGNFRDVTRQLPETAPILAIHGEEDLKFGKIALSLSERKTNAYALPVPYGHHAVHLDQPEAVAKLLGHFALTV